MPVALLPRYENQNVCQMFPGGVRGKITRHCSRSRHRRFSAHVVRSLHFLPVGTPTGYHSSEFPGLFLNLVWNHMIHILCILLSIAFEITHRCCMYCDFIMLSTVTLCEYITVHLSVTLLRIFELFSVWGYYE